MADLQPRRSHPFQDFSRRTARATGHPLSFLAAAAVIAAWLVTGPLFRFSDTWQLVINTGTTIVTFLMVFLIQNTQNRDTDATQLKLDELLRAIEGAKNSLINTEELTEEELLQMKKEYEKLAEKARREKQKFEIAGPGAKRPAAVRAENPD